MPEKMIRLICVAAFFSCLYLPVSAQCTLPDSTKWGAHDTVLTSAICYEGELIPYKESEMAWVSKMNEKQLEKYKREYDHCSDTEDFELIERYFVYSFEEFQEKETKEKNDYQEHSLCTHLLQLVLVRSF